MLVTCQTCRLQYDDTYRWTYCPHEKFAMNCTVSRQLPDGTQQVGIVTSLQELDSFLRKNHESN